MFYNHNLSSILKEPDAKKAKTNAATKDGESEGGGAADMTSKDYYFDSYSHFGE